MPVRYILSSVWVRLSIFSPLSIMQYMGLYVFSLPISLVMIERIHILCHIIIIKSEVWTISHYVGLGHETMVSAVCLSIFLRSFCLIEYAHHGPCNNLVCFQFKAVNFGANVDFNIFNIISGSYDRHFFPILRIFQLRALKITINFLKSPIFSRSFSNVANIFIVLRSRTISIYDILCSAIYICIYRDIYIYG